MGERRVIIAGNWKLHKGPAEAAQLISGIKQALSGATFDCEVVTAPPFTSICSAVEAAKDSPIKIAAQDVYWEDQGAFTGEVSAPMLKESGCSYVIIGHSERRQFFGETDETVNCKIIATLKAGLIPIFCVGETLNEREYGGTFDVIHRQVANGLQNVTIDDPDRFVIAYEPVWAIGTGKTASPEQAQEVHTALRKELSASRGADVANRVRILYGGSMKKENARSLIGQPDIDGGLIGGASLKVEDFLGIISAGSKS